jgi:hypothetical protein
MSRSIVLLVAIAAIATSSFAADRYEYRLLATTKTSTMQKELNEAAAAGFRYAAAMGGETAFGGSETVVVMQRRTGEPAEARYEYRLLATTKTSTMEKELAEAGALGFDYRGQTVFGTALGGDEVVVVLERDRAHPAMRFEYRLLATSKTSTMQRELDAASGDGFELLGVTVGQTAFGGQEVVGILRRGLE